MKKTICLFILILAIIPLIAIPVYGDVKPGTEVKSMKELISLSKKLNCEQVMICGDNNIAAVIDVNSLELLTWKQKKNVVDLSSEVLPAVTSIKNVAYFALNCKETDYALSIIDGVYQEEFIKPFDFIISQSELLGIQEKNGYYADKYQIADKWDLSALKDDDEIKLIISNEGQESVFDSNIEFKMTHFQSESDTVLVIWSDYPKAGLKDVFLKQKQSVEKNKTMAIFIDGLGWHVLANYCAEKGIDIKETQYMPTRSTYPSKTKYAYFMLGTGTYLPKQLGSQIYTEKPFQNGVIIEEEKCYYSSPTKIILHTDDNDNGTIDDEIFEKAMMHVKADIHQFILVHFHSVDDRLHEYGPFNSITMNQLTLILDYTEQLINEFDGDVIIFSDHGGHSYLNKGGTHGSVRAQDIIGVVKYVEKN
ncbi:MAG: alkaline phosphatase family protein [Candidatus Cloacimonadales bacterium]|jgi:hypothetical protein|nr:alkaline phosphatase family protein [Candidatus Cloacimonadota bacterium]MDD2650390.1 alkaline phosphatase family protein [Candidatus Cloacimonadota bacterium]MDX9978184.1 alkaline phosphatase family protein [Candidatus Cloacimonadales bacterium]